MAEPAINIEPQQDKLELFREQIADIITVNSDKSYLVSVKTADQFTLVDTVKVMVETERKAIWDDKDAECKKAHELHKSLVAKRDAAVAPYDTLKKALVDGNNAYLREEKRKAEEEAERLRLEAQKQAEEEQLAQAAELEAEGRIDEANEVLESEPIVIAAAPKGMVPKFNGKVYKTEPVYKVKVTNRPVFLTNVPMNTLLECLTDSAWTAIENGLSRKAKSLGRAFRMPGCTLTEM